MSVLKLVEGLSKTAVMAESDDLQALVQIQEGFEALSREFGTTALASVTGVVDRACRLVEDIILRKTEDADAAFNLVKATIEYVQQAVAANDSGRSLSAIGPSPFDDAQKAGGGEEIDAELLSAWVSGCEMAVTDLEGHVMNVASASDPAELMAEIRRGIHTLKGECGVLSLHDAQRLCHEAESAIDRAVEAKQPFPVDDILQLLDWIKGYAAALAVDCRAKVPDHADLLERLAKICPAPESSGAGSGSGASDNGDATAAAPSAASAVEAAPAQADDGSLVQFPSTAPDENLNDFLCESREHISNAEEAVLNLEQNLEDVELINTVFRAFHTIKGVAGFMQLTPIVTLSHNAEFLLDGARTGRVKFDSRHLDLILNSCDLLMQLIGMLEGGAPPTNRQLAVLVDQLQRASRGEAPVTASRRAKPAAKAAEGEPASGAPAAAGSGETHPAESSAEPGSSSRGGAAASAPAAAAAKRGDQTVKVSTGRMDSLVNMVGELVIAQQMVVQDPVVKGIVEPRLQRNLSAVGKIIRDLQEVSMLLRMVTLKATFQKMARLVRDVSQKAGKQIEFHTEGEDVELDRTVVEEIADPLVHMIRNSCDHGIETAEQRRAAGKPETGNLHLRAYHSGGSIIIEIEDDGRGLDRNKIIKKALEKGIWSPDRALEEIPDSEVYNLVFLPGFSTADKVTDISGRGVGMDVVRRNIEALRGKVEIRSTPGKGAVFMMRLPLTMAIIDGMVVRVGAQRYVVPTLNIERTFRPTAADIHTVVDRGEMASVRGSLLPIYRLNQVMRLEDGRTDLREALLLVVESNDSRCCLMVDEIIGQQQVVIKTLGQGINSIRGVSGGAILGDGRVALILDVSGIVAQATSLAAA